MSRSKINVEKPTILKLRRRKTLSPWLMYVVGVIEDWDN
jgi:hypothetical protein